ncbi:MAG: ketoacyl-ACP synthase III [Chloroflexi bacterium]|nr:ketoacyl-ACP synthase III [Chloroflexota bacterium]
MRQKLFSKLADLAASAIHRIIAADIKLVDILVPQRVINLLVSRTDRVAPGLGGLVNRHFISRVREADRRYLKGTVAKTVEGAVTYLSHGIAPVVIRGVQRHVPEATSSRKISTIVAGVGKYVPDSVIPTEYIEEWLQLKERFGLTAGMIDRLTGVRERRYAADGEASSDMAVRASLEALKRAGIHAEDIDTIIFAAASQDVGEPATANIVQEKLGARNAHVFDTKNACNSFVNALDVMDAFIQTGRSKVGLVASGEVISRFINWNIDDRQSLKKFMAGLTLGDGGGAMVLTAGNGLDEGRGIRGGTFLSDGSQWRLATITAGGNMEQFDPAKAFFASNGAELDKLASKYIPTTIERLLRRLGWRLDEVDLVISHQYTKHTISNIATMMDFPLSKCMLTVRKYGNTASASIPIALADAIEEGRVGPGSRVLLVGGAAGFSAGVVGVVL